MGEDRPRGQDTEGGVLSGRRGPATGAATPDEGGAPPEHGFKIHGRRRGHALRPRQAERVAAALARLRIDPAHLSDPAALFGGPVREVWLEIGFGGGEHLAWQAGHRPDVGIIGCEPFVNGVARLVAEIGARGLANVRVHDDDARIVLEELPDACLARVFILFPDPWPKKRHWKRRFVSPENLDRLARVMRPGAELRIASDWNDYVDRILRLLGPHPAFVWTARTAEDWRRRPADWPATRYEAKAIAAGRVPAYLSFLRR